MDQLILPLLLVLLFVPFIMATRRQRRQVAQMQQLQSSLAVGDRVMTTSGLQATVVAFGEDTIDLEIAPGVVTTWMRQVVRERLTEPAAEPVQDSVVVDEADRR
jgi:preprotein translocase subunit YajC